MDTEKFNDLFLFGPKSKIKAGDGLKKGRFPFYTSSPILSKWIDTEQYFDEALVFGTGGLPSIHYAKEPFSTSTDCLVAIAKSNKSFNVKFVFYYIYSNIRILEQGFKGAGLKHISKPYIQNIDIPLPDLETQDKIVTILDKAKNLSEKRERTIQMFDELLRSIFLYMFGDPYVNPKKWSVGKLGNYLEFIGDIGSNGSNATISKNLNMLDEKDHAIMIRTVNLSKNNFKDNLKYASKETYDFFKKTKIYGGEIIMNKIGSAGDFWLMPKLNIPVTLGLNQLVIRPKNLENLFLFYFLSSNYGRLIVKSKIRGAATQSITKTAVKELDIIIPPLDLQKKFTEIVLKIYASLEKLNHSKNQLEDLLGGLSQSAFNGKLEFNTAVDLEVLLENDYEYFKDNADKKTVQLLLDRLDKNELNLNKFHDQDLYNKAKDFVFELLKEGYIKQVFDDKTRRVKLTI